MNAAYQRLKSRHARIATLGEASAMLGWDASAMMPQGGGAARGDQLALLAGMMHELALRPRLPRIWRQPRPRANGSRLIWR